MSYTKADLVQAQRNNYWEQLVEDSRDAAELLLDIYTDGYKPKGWSQMTKDELEKDIKDEGGICNCDRIPKETRSEGAGVDNGEGDCQDCGAPLTFEGFIELWNNR
jgi:hypothetical protein